MDGTAGNAFTLTRRTVSAELRLGGELDIAAVEPLTEAVDLLLDEGCTLLDLDLGDVTFMDAAGLGLLVRLQGTCREHGGALRLRGLCEQPQWLLRISGMESAFDIRDPLMRPTLRGVIRTPPEKGQPAG